MRGFLLSASARRPLHPACRRNYPVRRRKNPARGQKQPACRRFHPAHRLQNPMRRPKHPARRVKNLMRRVKNPIHGVFSSACERIGYVPLPACGQRATEGAALECFSRGPSEEPPEPKSDTRRKAARRRLFRCDTVEGLRLRQRPACARVGRSARRFPCAVRPGRGSSRRA